MSNDITNEEAIDYFKRSYANGNNDDERYHNEVLAFAINTLKEKTCENCSFKEHQEVCITCSRNYSDKYYDGEVAFPEENDNRH